ncbi:hypothetical protein [Leisingera sp. JC11]|uniref:hypothetical protein n=1 Tax=Leisingera sp. JC11 TaxID=3042469 RepID=UPI0034556107
MSRLIKGLGSAEGVEEAKEALRSLVERIVLTPAAESTGLDLTLERDLAELLRLAADTQNPNTVQAPDVLSETFDMSCELVLAAGAGNRRILPALSAIK